MVNLVLIERKFSGYSDKMKRPLRKKYYLIFTGKDWGYMHLSTKEIADPSLNQMSLIYNNLRSLEWTNKGLFDLKRQRWLE